MAHFVAVALSLLTAVTGPIFALSACVTQTFAHLSSTRQETCPRRDQQKGDIYCSFSTFAAMHLLLRMAINRCHKSSGSRTRKEKEIEEICEARQGSERGEENKGAKGESPGRRRTTYQMTKVCYITRGADDRTDG